MPVHSIANYLDDVSSNLLISSAASIAALVAFKRWAGGRKCTWEREWGGKMILISAPPTSTTLALIHNLLHLPSPPQILYLPPLPSPLPQSLLTILHTLRISATRSSPLAQLHCDALPPTPRAVRELVKKWVSVPHGMPERRIDALVLSGGWQVEHSIFGSDQDDDLSSHFERAKEQLEERKEVDPDWTPEQFHFHLVTSLLPVLLKFPVERNVRIIKLVAPTYRAAIPSFASASSSKSIRGALQQSGLKALQALLLQNHFQRILNTLLAASLASVKPVPALNGSSGGKKRDQSVQSNLMAIGVVMPWDRESVIKPLLGAQTGKQGYTWWNWFFYLLLWPIILISTPGASQSVQSIMFALNAPVRYGPVVEQAPKVVQTQAEDKEKVKSESGNGRREAVAGGDVVRDCAVIDMPPFIHDPMLGREQYEILEKQVEKGVKESLQREKAYPPRPVKRDDEDDVQEPDVDL